MRWPGRKDVDRKGTVRRFKERKKPVRGAVVDRTWDVRAEETRRLQLYEGKKAESEKAWKGEDALEVLDAVNLQTLDASRERRWRCTKLVRH